MSAFQAKIRTKTRRGNAHNYSRCRIRLRAFRAGLGAASKTGFEGRRWNHGGNQKRGDRPGDGRDIRRAGVAQRRRPQPVESKARANQS